LGRSATKKKHSDLLIDEQYPSWEYLQNKLGCWFGYTTRAGQFPLLSIHS